MSVDRSCGIRGPCHSRPEAVLSCPWAGLRGSTVLWFKDHGHSESLPLWSASQTHIPPLWESTWRWPRSHRGALSVVTQWQRHDDRLARKSPDWHHGLHLHRAPLNQLTSACRRQCRSIWALSDIMDINMFRGGVHGVLGTASLSKKEHVLRMRLLIYLLWLRTFFGRLVGLNWRMMRGLSFF